MRLMTGVLFALLLISLHSAAQSANNGQDKIVNKKYAKWEAKHDKLDPFAELGAIMLYRLSCDEAENTARQRIKTDSIIYLVPDAFILYYDKPSMLTACILKKDFNIVPYGASFTCSLTENNRLIQIYDSYTCVIDSFLSTKYQTDFPKLLESRVNEALKLPKKDLLKLYPFMQYYSWPRK